MAITPLAAPTDGTPVELLLEFPDNRLLIELCGEFDRNISQIEHLLSVHILRRGNQLAVLGDAREEAVTVLNWLYARLEAGRGVEPGDIDAAVRLGNSDEDTGTRDGDQIEMFKAGSLEIGTRKKTVEPRTEAQQAYVRALYDHELAFGIGPAGTGKTYLAVAVAVNQMINGHVDKIILSRPAVEAGERLGFLPGDMKDALECSVFPIIPARK